MEKEAYLVLLEKKAEENVVYQPYEGAKEFIDKLRQQGIQVGFVTDSVREHAIKALTSMGVYNSKTDALVDRADISDDPTPKGNNRQAAIQKAVAHYGVKPDRDVWYVGNDSVEIEDAMKLGCTGIGYGVNTRAAEWAEGLKEGSVNSMYDTPISRDQLEVAPTYKSLSTLLEHSQKMGKSSRTPGS